MRTEATMGFRVLYHLNTGNIKGIAEEARWAEGMGYDGLCTEETGHDPLLPLALAATATSRVTLEPRVAIAFPPLADGLRLRRHGLAEPVRRALPAGAGNAGQGPHRAPLLDGVDAARPPNPGIRAVPSCHLGRLAERDAAGLPRRALQLLADDAIFQPRPVGAAAPAGIHQRGQRLQLPRRRGGMRRAFAASAHVAGVPEAAYPASHRRRRVAGRARCQVRQPYRLRVHHHRPQPRRHRRAQVRGAAADSLLFLHPHLHHGAGKPTGSRTWASAFTKCRSRASGTR